MLKNRSVKNLTSDQIINIYTDKLILDMPLVELSKKYNTTEHVILYLLKRKKYTPPEFIGVEYTKRYPGKNGNRSTWVRAKGQEDSISIDYKLRRRIHARTREAFKKIGVRVNSNEIDKIIGPDVTKIRLWIEKQFKNGMSWKNFSTWHLDHRTPLSMASDTEELKMLCHYTNIQPLLCIDNCKKGAL